MPAQLRSTPGSRGLRKRAGHLAVAPVELSLVGVTNPLHLLLEGERWPRGSGPEMAQAAPLALP